MSFESFEGTFSVIVLSLNLQESGVKKLFSKSYPYTFTPKAIMAAMNKISYRLEFGGQKLAATISVAKSSQRAIVLQYLAAHLVHMPGARCDSKLGSDDMRTLQLTAKGVATVEKFCNQFELEHAYRTSLFTSRLNTMKLVNMSRSPVHDQLETSDVMCNVLWNHMLGTKPHIWSEQLEDDGSPFFHQYLLHPSGNAHSQYYNSQGILLFSDVKFRASGEEETYSADLVMSGRAMWQWVMDCTNVRTAREAQLIVEKFVEKRFVRRIKDQLCSTITCADDFPVMISRSTMYHIAGNGYSTCGWAEDYGDDTTFSLSREWIEPAAISPQRTSMFPSDLSASAALDLASILSDPGLRMLFEKTVDINSASENLKFINEFVDFKMRFALVGSPEGSLNGSPKGSPRLAQGTPNPVQRSSEPAAAKDADSRRAMLGLWQALNNLVWRYIAVDSCLEVNIPDARRKQILDLMESKARVPHRDMYARISQVVASLTPIEQHIRDLLASFIPTFLRDPQNMQLSNLCGIDEPAVQIETVQIRSN